MIDYLRFLVLGKLPPSPNANPKPNPNPDRGAIFLGGNFPDTKIFNTYFINSTKTLDLKPSIISTTKSVSEIIETFKDHPIINE